jgi:hypothetical protein
MSNGKGSRPRPKTVDNATWDKNYENIFGKREKKSSLPVDKPIKHDRIEESKQENRSRD